MAIKTVKSNHHDSRSSAFKQSLTVEANELTNATAARVIKDSADNLDTDLRRVRDELLNGINKASQPAEISSAAPDTPQPTIKPELRWRLWRRRLRKRLIVLVPLLAVALYAAVFVARLDRFWPDLPRWLPWPAAIIDGKIVWLDELNEQTRLIGRLKTTSDAENLALQHLTERVIIEHEFTKSELDFDTTLLKQELERLTSEFGSLSSLQEYLFSTYGVNTTLFIEHVLKPYIRRWQLQQYMNSDPESIVAAEKRATQALAVIKEENLDFSTAAKRLSEDESTKELGGEIGWLALETMPSELKAILQSLKVGEISSPVRTANGIHIFKLNDIETTASENTSTASVNVNVSHIFFAIADFDSWLKQAVRGVRVIRLVPWSS